jgi:murein DD-endopeptidase MepM/ murein hydrolase activator NlpD
MCKGKILQQGGVFLEKKPKRIDKREYTLMIVPHHGQKVRSIRIPIIAVKYTISLLCLIIVFMAGSFVEYRHTLSITGTQKAELEILRQNDGAQVSQIEQLARITTSLQADMERLNSLDAEIRRIVNNDDVAVTSRAGLVRPSVSYNGQGGPQVEPNINNIKAFVNDLQSAVKVREQSLAELKQELLVKKARMEATPSIWPTNGDVTSRFGSRSSPFDGGSDWHPGIDIANSSGTTIVATADGEVIQSEWYGGYGNMVQIDHGNGIRTIYAHNSQIIVHTGQVVKKGQIIAYMGNTGYSTGPHLHYEIRVNGTTVNPMNFLN